MSLEFATEDGFLHFCDSVQSENQHERYLAFDYLVALYAALAHQQVTVLFVDDAHFADELSLDLLAYLARSTVGQRLMLVLTARTEVLTEQHPLRNWMRAVNQSVGYQSLTLEPLSLEESTALLHTTFPNLKVASSTVAPSACGDPWQSVLSGRDLRHSCRPSILCVRKTVGCFRH